MNLRVPLSDLSPSEPCRFTYTLIGFMFVASAALIARAVGDTLFLSRYSTDLLSYMYIGTALVVGLAAYPFGAWAGARPGGLEDGKVGLALPLPHKSCWSWCCISESEAFTHQPQL